MYARTLIYIYMLMYAIHIVLCNAGDNQGLKNIQNVKLLLFFSVSIFVIAVLFAKKIDFDIIPFSFMNTLFVLPFFVSGCIYKTIYNKFTNHTVLATCFYTWVFVLFRIFYKSEVSFASMKFYNPIFDLICAYVGILMVVSVCSFCKKSNKIIEIIAKNTLYVYLIHFIGFWAIFRKVVDIIYDHIFMVIIWSIIYAAIVVLLVSIISNLFRSYFRSIFLLLTVK